MRYQVFPPSSVLTPYIMHFAISEMAEESRYKVLPDNGLVMGFQYRGRLSLLQETGKLDLSFCGLSGLHDSWRMFQNVPGTGTVLAYFKPGAAASFFRQPLHELFGDSVSMEHFMRFSQVQEMEERLSELDTDAQKIGLIEGFLIDRLAPKTDALVQYALSIINQQQGTVRIKELLAQVHASQSSLEKRFRQMVGTSPKKYARILRLKHVIDHYNPAISLTAAAYQAGFYDQAHFINDFKAFTGESPESFFKPTFR